MRVPFETALTLILLAGVSWLLVVEGLAKRQLVWRKPRRPLGPSRARRRRRRERGARHEGS